MLRQHCCPLVVRSTPYDLVQDACLVRAADKPKQRRSPSVSEDRARDGPLRSPSMKCLAIEARSFHKGERMGASAREDYSIGTLTALLKAFRRTAEKIAPLF